MKKILGGILLFTAMCSAACGGAPTDTGDESATAARLTKAQQHAAVEATATKPVVYGKCTTAELKHCIATDPGDFGSACETVNGVPVCEYE